MTRLLCVGLLLLAMKLQAEEHVQIDSTLAQYDGNLVTLDGNVSVDHEFGKISANHVELKIGDEDQVQFPVLTMEGQVKIGLKDGAELTCAKAEINYKIFEGKFFGDASGYVRYSEQFNKDTRKLPLTVKSREMTIQLKTQIDQKQAHTPRSCISNISADQEVEVKYNNELTVLADHATYHRLPYEPNEDEKAIPGVISLYANSDHGICRVISQEGDSINSTRICIDTSQKKLLFAYPEGMIRTSWSSKEQSLIDFSGDSLTWDAQQNILTLQKHVIIRHPTIGTLSTDHDVKLIQKKINGKKVLGSIVSQGKTVLTYIDAKNSGEHTLTCYGVVHVDHEHLQTKMESPKSITGITVEGQQITFDGYLGQVYADNLIIFYELSNRHPILKRIILENNVRMRGNTQPNASAKSGTSSMHYALADKVEYTPELKEMRFSANGNGRVLFYDNINNLQVSAPALILHRDQATGKDSIKGQGDVRFSFVKQELKRMNEILPGAFPVGD